MGGSAARQSKFAALARMPAQKKLSLGFFSGPCTTASPTVCWLSRDVSGPGHAHRQTQLQPICALAAAFASSPQRNLSDFPQISACSYELAHLSAWPCSPVPQAAVSSFQLSYALKELNCSFLNKAQPACLSVLMRFMIAYRSKLCSGGFCLYCIKRKGEVTSKVNRTTRNKINFHIQFFL